MATQTKVRLTEVQVRALEQITAHPYEDPSWLAMLSDTTPAGFGRAANSLLRAGLVDWSSRMAHNTHDGRGRVTYSASPAGREALRIYREQQVKG